MGCHNHCLRQIPVVSPVASRGTVEALVSDGTLCIYLGTQMLAVGTILISWPSCSSRILEPPPPTPPLPVLLWLAVQVHSLQTMPCETRVCVLIGKGRQRFTALRFWLTSPNIWALLVDIFFLRHVDKYDKWERVATARERVRNETQLVGEACVLCTVRTSRNRSNTVAVMSPQI